MRIPKRQTNNKEIPMLLVLSRKRHSLFLLLCALAYTVVYASCSVARAATDLLPAADTERQRRLLLFITPPSSVCTTRRCFTKKISFNTLSSFRDVDNGNVKDRQDLRSSPSVSSTENENAPSTSSCPFSRTFPRYRIRLTSSSSSSAGDKSTKSNGGNKNPLFSFFGPSSSSSSRNGDSQPQKRAVQRANPGRPIRWLDQQDGIQAYASMWRGVADLQDRILLNAEGEQQTDSGDNYSLILGFPHANAQILHNFCEILDWAQQQPGLLFCLEDTSDGKSGAIAMGAQFQPEGPAVCLTIRRRRGQQELSSPSPLPSQHEQQPEAIIPPTVANNTDEYTEILNRRTRAWVDRVLVNLGICPFTKSSKTSGQGLADLGVPVGRIAYHASFVNTTTTHTSINRSSNSHRPMFDVARLMADTWEAIHAMIQAGPRYQDGGISSILLAAPDFDDHLDIWTGPVFSMLEAGVMAARAEKDIGVVCFHPQYATPDGKTWPGFGHMHSVPRLQKWILQQREERQEEQRAAELEKRRLLMITGNRDDTTTATTLAEPAIDTTLLVAGDEGGDELNTIDSFITSPPSDATDESDDCTFNYCQVAAGGAWQRRTPHATINVLRADQLEIAEKTRNSAHLYPKNIAKLLAIGNDQLQHDLDRERNMQ